MAYNITKSDGTALVTVSDGLSDQTSSSLTLIGKNFSGYGEFLNENLVALLENFAKTTEPRSPMTGQLWWDSSVGALKVKSAGGWKQFSAAVPASAQPSTSIEGDMWWDTTNKQLKVYNGTSYTLVGPAYSSVAGTSGAIVESVADSSANNHVVVKIYTSGKTVAILSQDPEFIPNPPIIGFASVKPGVTLASTSSIAGARFYGMADDAASLGGALAANYARTDIESTFANSVIIASDSGLTLGTSSSFSQTVSSGAVSLTNRYNNANITVSANVGGTITTAMQVVGSTGNVNVTKLNATTLVSSGNTTLSGNVTLANTVLPSANVTYNLGSTSLRFANVFASVVNAVSTSAQYADLAERFESDASYPAGTVVAIGGIKEVTAAEEELSEDVFGVISTNAAYLMNAGAGSNATHPPIAVNGRVPVRVIGCINKGDRLVAAGNGLARAGNRNEISSFNVIGRSLENKTTDGEGVILAIVKLNS